MNDTAENRAKGKRMLEVYTWEPSADSGKPLFCLKEKQVPFVHHYLDLAASKRRPRLLVVWPQVANADVSGMAVVPMSSSLRTRPASRRSEPRCLGVGLLGRVVSKLQVRQVAGAGR